MGDTDLDTQPELAISHARSPNGSRVYIPARALYVRFISKLADTSTMVTVDHAQCVSLSDTDSLALMMASAPAEANLRGGTIDGGKGLCIVTQEARIEALSELVNECERRLKRADRPSAESWLDYQRLIEEEPLAGALASDTVLHDLLWVDTDPFDRPAVQTRRRAPPVARGRSGGRRAAARVFRIFSISHRLL